MIVDERIAVGDAPVATVLEPETMFVTGFEMVLVDIVAIVPDGLLEAVLLAVDIIVAVVWLGTVAFRWAATVATVLEEIVVLLIIDGVWFAIVVVPVFANDVVVVTFETVAVVLLGGKVVIVWFEMVVVALLAVAVVVVTFEAVVVALLADGVVVWLAADIVVVAVTFAASVELVVEVFLV